MIFTIAEKRLLMLFSSGIDAGQCSGLTAGRCSCIIAEISDALCQALPDMTDPDDCAAARSLMVKLGNVGAGNETAYIDAFFERG